MNYIKILQMKYFHGIDQQFFLHPGEIKEIN